MVFCVFQKNKRKKDQLLLEKFRRRRCDICGKYPSDPAHIKTVGSGGNDEDWNLLALCREHHTIQHSIGFFKMCEKYPFLRMILAEKGWIFGAEKKLRRE